MTRTPLLLALVAVAALAGCDNNGQTIVAGPNVQDDNSAAVNLANVQLPPSIAASRIYRCKDNSIVYIDWLSDQSVNFRAERREAPIRLTASEAGEPLTAEGGYSLTGSAEDSSVTLARPDKGAQSCKA